MARVCPDCIFYNAADTTCRISPPVSELSGNTPITYWPKVGATDWCGDGYNAEFGYYGASLGAPPQQGD